MIITELAIDESHQFASQRDDPPAEENALPVIGMLENVAEADELRDDLQEERKEWVKE